MTRPLDIGEIVAMMTDRADKICFELFPNGIKEGREFRIGSLAGEVGRSMGVCLSGPKAGVWADFHTGEGGDILDLVAQTLFSGDKAKALSWARRFLGIDGRSPADIAQTRRRAEARKKRGQKEERETRKAAFRRWLEAQEDIRGTPVEEYLEGRGIALERLGYRPRSIKFHPNLFNNERQGPLPAMVAAIIDHTGKFVSLHRTWLELENVQVVKARLKDAKKTYGRFAGGTIRLWRGGTWTERAGARVWRRAEALDKAAEGSSVVLAQGIEDGLSIAIECPETRVLAAVSDQNMANLILPPAIKRVIMCVDNEDNEAAQKASEKWVAEATRRFQSEGRTVLVARSPIGKDFNDALREGTAR